MITPLTKTQQNLYFTTTAALAAGGSVVLALGAPAWLPVAIGVILLGGAVSLMINLSILYSVPPKPRYTHLTNI